jgi:hypothetical protein
MKCEGRRVPHEGCRLGAPLALLVIVASCDGGYPMAAPGVWRRRAAPAILRAARGLRGPRVGRRSKGTMIARRAGGRRPGPAEVGDKATVRRSAAPGRAGARGHRAGRPPPQTPPLPITHNADSEGDGQLGAKKIR